MFSIVLNIVGTLLHWYVAHALYRIAPLRGRIRARWWWSGTAVLWLLYIWGVQLGDSALDWRWWPGQFAVNWLGLTFVLGQYLLLADLATGFGLWWRRRVQAIRMGAACAGLAVAAFGFTQALRAPAIVEHDIVLPSLPHRLDGTVVVAVSDLHLGAQRRAGWMAARVEQINAARPDLVVLLGDQVEDDPVNDAGLAPALQAIQARLGVWAVTGNHEYYGDVATTIDEFSAGGVKWLHNGQVTPVPGLTLVGLDDIGRARKRGSDVTAGLGRARQAHASGATILLAHIPAPELVDAAAQDGIDLMLSGHTHGGQIWPFNYLVKRQFPHVVGWHQVGPMQLVISRGAGSWGPRMRLWQRGEILRLTLRSGAT